MYQDSCRYVPSGTCTPSLSWYCIKFYATPAYFFCDNALKLLHFHRHILVTFNRERQLVYFSRNSCTWLSNSCTWLLIFAYAPTILWNRFVLLSERCICCHKSKYVYHWSFLNISFQSMPKILRFPFLVHRFITLIYFLLTTFSSSLFVYSFAICHFSLWFFIVFYLFTFPLSSFIYNSYIIISLLSSMYSTRFSIEPSDDEQNHFVLSLIPDPVGEGFSIFF